VIYNDLKQRGIRAFIPPKSNRTKTVYYNKRLYRQRNCIEPRLEKSLQLIPLLPPEHDMSSAGQAFDRSIRRWR
jgi:hypothetical protein